MPVRTFASPYAAASPMTVWTRRPRTFELGEYRPMSVRLPDTTYWVGTVYEPDRITPGEAVSVTLYLYDPQPSEIPFQTVISLNAADGSGRRARQEAMESRQVVVDDPAVGRVTADRFTLPTPEGLDLGAYFLSASVLTGDIDRSTFIYEGASTLPVNRVTLGYVVVPWRGSLDGVARVGAVLGERIRLVGYEALGDPAPGAALDVRLYWEALRPLEDVTVPYFAFVHVLDGSGALVTQHDGPVSGGRYPLPAWIPGEVIPDPHTVVLPADMPPGAYRLQTGIYTWPDFDRLSAQDADGAPLSDGVVVLGELEVK
jgi:hypothetical protein